MYKLLIADDEQIERDALRYIITRSCERIDEIMDASNGREAIEIAESEHPDIAIMDVKMPGKNGVDAARELRERSPAVRLVFLTAFDYFDYAQEAVRLGADDFIVKPATDERVVEVITGVLDRLDESRLREREHESDRRRLEQMRAVLERDLVAALVAGAVVPEQLTEQFDALGLGSPGAWNTYALSVEIDFDSYPTRVESSGQRRILARRCSGELGRAFSAEGMTVLACTQDALVHQLLLHREEISPEALVAVAGKEVENIRRKLSMVVHVGLDPTPRPPDDAVRGFRHAVVARASADEGRPSVRTDIARQSIPRSRHARSRPEGVDCDEERYPYDLEQELCRAVIAGEVEQAVTVASHAVDRLAVSEPNIQRIRRRLAEMLTVVTRELDLTTDDIEDDGIPVLDQLEQAASQADLRTAIRSAAFALTERADSAPRETSHTAVERVRTFIERNFERDIPLEEAAARARFSPHYFSRAFKVHTGMTFVDYVNAVRVDRAKRLLRDSDLTIKEIAAAVGIGDPNYFSRVFKQHARLTPSEYRSKSLL